MAAAGQAKPNTATDKTAALPARVANARELRKAVWQLPWGPEPERVALHEDRAHRRAMDALIRAEVAEARDRSAITPARLNALARASDRADITKRDRIAWVLRTLY